MNKKNKLFLAVGRLEYQKGYDLLIEIFHKYKTIIKNSKWKLYIVGDGSQKNLLENKIKKLNLLEDIILTGATTNVKKYYKQSDIFLMTSRWEGMPLVLDEALLFQLPIIAFDCETGPREMITDGVNGFLVPQNDLDTFVEKIILLTNNNSLLEQLKRGCNSTLEGRSDQAILNKWKNLFEEIGGL